MLGTEFVEILRSELSAKNDSELARLLGVTPPSISTLKKTTNIGNRQVANFIKRIIEHKSENILENAIETVVEYFPIESILGRSEKRWYFFDSDKNETLYNVLKKNIGLYSFYNSEGKIIYLGQTKKNLFDEMLQTYNREITNYSMFAVEHPREKYRPDPDGKLKKLKKIRIKLADTAAFFSCYIVDKNLVSPLEALLIRISANNLINSRMEASLQSVGVAAQPEK